MSLLAVDIEPFKFRSRIFGAIWFRVLGWWVGGAIGRKNVCFIAVEEYLSSSCGAYCHLLMRGASVNWRMRELGFFNLLNASLLWKGFNRLIMGVKNLIDCARIWSSIYGSATTCLKLSSCHLFWSRWYLLPLMVFQVSVSVPKLITLWLHLGTIRYYLQS
jgi:hypothetical protein